MGGFQSRWRNKLSPADARDVDAMLAPLLRTLGYATDAAGTATMALRRLSYGTRFSLRDLVKRRSWLGRRGTSLAHFAKGSMRITEEKLAGVRSDVSED